MGSQRTSSNQMGACHLDYPNHLHFPSYRIWFRLHHWRIQILLHYFPGNSKLQEVVSKQWNLSKYYSHQSQYLNEKVSLNVSAKLSQHQIGKCTYLFHKCCSFFTVFRVGEEKFPGKNVSTLWVSENGCEYLVGNNVLVSLLLLAV